LNLYYSESAGILHVVNVHDLDSNVMLQSEIASFVSVNLLSRKELDLREADYKFYQTRRADLKKSRFYITDGSTCGDAPFNNGDLSALGRLGDMYIRARDAKGGSTPFGFALDPATDDYAEALGQWDVSVAGPVPSKWATMFSLTTGWAADQFKISGGQGTPNPGASATGSFQHSSYHGSVYFPPRLRLA